MRLVRILNFSLCLCLLLLSVFTSGSSGQITKDEFLKQLTAAATLSESDLASLRSGNILVKVLPSRDKRDVSVFGAVRLQDIQHIDLAGFRAGLSQRNNKSMLGGGAFSAEPGLQDLAALTVDDGDIESMKSCVIGDCDLKLSAAIIQRFRTEIDWSSPDQKGRATELFKSMLIDYARDYLKRGDRALIEYADKKKPVRLADQYRAMMESTTPVRSIAPELLEYLRKFPTAELQGTESRVDWSKVESGLKPIVTLTHNVGYSRQSQDDLFLTFATKQIYATHYVDASLAFTSFLRFGAGESAEAYLAFSSISRSESLGGALGGMARSMVESEALQRAEDLLRRSKIRLEAKTSTAQRSEADEPETGIISRIGQLSRSWTIRILAIIIVAALALWIAFRWKPGK